MVLVFFLKYAILKLSRGNRLVTYKTDYNDDTGATDQQSVLNAFLVEGILEGCVRAPTCTNAGFYRLTTFPLDIFYWRKLCLKD